MEREIWGGERDMGWGRIWSRGGGLSAGEVCGWVDDMTIDLLWCGMCGMQQPDDKCRKQE